MGLNTLNAVLEKKGPEYVDKFLSEEIIITEKLDTYRILFENINGELKFFKKDNSEISLIERTLTDIWETALIEIPILVQNVNLPEGIRFGVAYTPIERPIRIPYSNLPTYILTDITRREGNKVIEVYDYDEVTQWSGLLSMARPPIIFEGKLTKEQKKHLLSYDKNEYDSNNYNFPKLIERWFGKTYSKEDIIEGIIIKGKDQLAQILSYEFKLLDEAYQHNYGEKKSRDLYDLLLISLNEFMDNYRIPFFEAEAPDQIYINIICDIFNNYCKEKYISESLDPQYLTPPSYGYMGKLNKKFIKNRETLKILKNGALYESIFKVLLSSFRKYKKEYGLLNEEAVKKFNTFVYIINKNSQKLNEDFDHEMGRELELINEEKIEEARSDNVVVKALEKKQASDVDNMRIIASIQKAFDPMEIKIKGGSEPCAVYLTDLTPFTKSQEENLFAIYRSWKVPVIIGTIGGGRRVKGEEFYFSDALLKAQLDSIAIFNKDIVPNYFILSAWDLNEIFEYVRPSYEPIALITDEGKKSDLVIQLYFEEKVMGGRIGVEPKFNIGEMEVEDKLKALRCIEDSLFYGFREVAPKSTLSLFNSMVSEYKNWSGQVPKPV